jgi:hypothetical protein
MWAPLGVSHPVFALGIPALLSDGFKALQELSEDVRDEYVKPLMGWRYYHTNSREAYSWATSEYQVGFTADVRPGVTTPASPDAMDGKGGDGSMGEIPLVLITANTGLTRSWRR